MFSSFLTSDPSALQTWLYNILFGFYIQFVFEFVAVPTAWVRLFTVQSTRHPGLDTIGPVTGELGTPSRQGEEVSCGPNINARL